VVLGLLSMLNATYLTLIFLVKSPTRDQHNMPKTNQPIRQNRKVHFHRVSFSNEYPTATECTVHIVVIASSYASDFGGGKGA